MPKKILVVDDEPDIVQWLETNLVDAGYQVTTMLDGRDALQKLQAEKPDLLVLDDRMPSMDGLAVLRELNADPGSADIPVIMIADQALYTNVFRSYQAGVDAYLTKPVNPSELLAYVKHIVDSQAGMEGNGLAIEGDEHSPLIRLAHTILQQALDTEVSEILVEPQSDRVDIRFRIDGATREALRLPIHLHRKLVARYKVMADVDVEEQSLPQDGRIAVAHRGKEYDLRVHSRPTPNGEKVAIVISAQ